MFSDAGKFTKTSIAALTDADMALSDPFFKNAGFSKGLAYNLVFELVNAADHGVESDAERRMAGKVVPATVWLSTIVAGGEVVIEVRDDGRGIDWNRVRQLATEKRLAAGSQRDLEQALLSEGFSLKYQVSEISGRGVGLSAVRNVVSAMGGKIEVESKPGQGTTWRFRFSLSTLGEPDADAEPTRPLTALRSYQ